MACTLMEPFCRASPQTFGGRRGCYCVAPHRWLACLGGDGVVHLPRRRAQANTHHASPLFNKNREKPFQYVIPRHQGQRHALPKKNMTESAISAKPEHPVASNLENTRLPASSRLTMMSFIVGIIEYYDHHHHNHHHYPATVCHMHGNECQQCMNVSDLRRCLSPTLSLCRSTP